MALQSLIVALLVAGCGVYAAWSLMPAVLRRRAASALLRWPLPGFVAAPLRRAVQSAGAHGCSGCDAATPVHGARAVHVHRRKERDAP